jgi:hypothetical protein
MLFKIDSHFGHVIEETANGIVYQVDGSPVDPANPRSCAGCKVRCREGEQDPCIANLPGTSAACCGHGLDVTPVYKSPNGYVALDDGRRMSFSGLVGGERIRAAVEAALRGEELPDGFSFDDTRMWWTGLSDYQRQHVHNHMLEGLARLVTEAKKGEAPSARFLNGEAMWWDGLDEEQKAYVWAHTGEMIAQLVEEAKRL